MRDRLAERARQFRAKARPVLVGVLVLVLMTSGVAVAQQGQNFTFIEAHDVSANTVTVIGVDYQDGLFYVADGGDVDVDIYNTDWEYQETISTPQSVVTDVEVESGTIHVVGGGEVVRIDQESHTVLGQSTLQGAPPFMLWNGSRWIGTGAPTDENTPSTTVRVYDSNFNHLHNETAGVAISDVHRPETSTQYYATDTSETVHRLESNFDHNGSLDVTVEGFESYYGIAHSDEHWYVSDPGGDTVIEYTSDFMTTPSPTNGDRELEISTRDYIMPNESAPYSVHFNDSGEWSEVTENATVTSNNTSVLTVNSVEHLLQGQPGVNTTVNVTAEYTDANGSVFSTTKEVAVAQATVENLEILPAIWRFGATFGDDTIFFLIIATLTSIVATRFSTAFGGLSLYWVVVMLGWFSGWVSLGILLLATVMCMFIGLNLAANINYTKGISTDTASITEGRTRIRKRK